VCPPPLPPGGWARFFFVSGQTIFNYDQAALHNNGSVLPSVRQSVYEHYSVSGLHLEGLHLESRNLVCTFIWASSRSSSYIGDLERSKMSSFDFLKGSRRGRWGQLSHFSETV
jgi:hypothetical protein